MVENIILPIGEMAKSLDRLSQFRGAEFQACEVWPSELTETAYSFGHLINRPNDIFDHLTFRPNKFLTYRALIKMSLSTF